MSADSRHEPSTHPQPCYHEIRGRRAPIPLPITRRPCSTARYPKRACQRETCAPPALVSFQFDEAAMPLAHPNAAASNSCFPALLTREQARDGLGEHGHIVRLPQKCISAGTPRPRLDLIAGEYNDRRLLPMSHRPRLAYQLDPVRVRQLMVKNQNIVASAALKSLQRG